MLWKVQINNENHFLAPAPVRSLAHTTATSSTTAILVTADQPFFKTAGYKNPESDQHDPQGDVGLPVRPVHPARKISQISRKEKPIRSVKDPPLAQSPNASANPRRRISLAQGVSSSIYLTALLVTNCPSEAQFDSILPPTPSQPPVLPHKILSTASFP